MLSVFKTILVVSTLCMIVGSTIPLFFTSHYERHKKLYNRMWIYGIAVVILTSFIMITIGFIIEVR